MDVGTNYVDSLAAQLDTLLRDGGLAMSQVSARARQSLQPLLDARVLEIRRAGAGKRLLVANRDALIGFINQRYPVGLVRNTPSGMGPKAEAVATVRDSKKASAANQEPVIFRAFGDVSLRCPSSTLPLGEMTKTAGVAAAIFSDSCEWTLDGAETLVTVENLEPFLHIEDILPTAVAVYAGGRLSGRMIGWLSQMCAQGLHVVHAGDYDPVGLDEYWRLRQALSNHVTLHVPDDLEVRFSTFGKRQLLIDSEPVLQRLRQVSDESVRYVVQLMDRYTCGLEQEALFAPVNT